MQTKIKNLLLCLSEAINNNPRFELLNDGGCCVFAAMVAAKLEELGIPVKGRVLRSAFSWVSSTNAPLNKIHPKKNTLDAWQDNGVSFDHVVLQLEKYTYDSGGFDARKRWSHFDMYRGWLNVKDLKELAKSRGWNSMFDRKLIPELQKIVDNVFAEVHHEDNKIPVYAAAA